MAVARKDGMKTAWKDLKEWLVMWSSFALFVAFQATFIYGMFHFFGRFSF